MIDSPWHPMSYEDHIASENIIEILRDIEDSFIRQGVLADVLREYCQYCGQEQPDRLGGCYCMRDD